MLGLLLFFCLSENRHFVVIANRFCFQIIFVLILSILGCKKWYTVNKTLTKNTTERQRKLIEDKQRKRDKFDRFAHIWRGYYSRWSGNKEICTVSKHHANLYWTGFLLRHVHWYKMWSGRGINQLHYNIIEFR